ncbi:MAG TPA: bifunctional precorrin-2 dehydrogenase/sirohydrochlorin ferrochelatase [Methanocella sp.]|uniref:precorrin-2 dehydrogenase/sirohydrochlorin ferrochelatase family protein n=1 Tax=Methanocella sp. TaxID=2052833 RepID=UPI002B5F85A5|nr:bifunctional precorrin-2 dehydrogenase/sirohydrochlorin ferrochelatase [Methanocella sp.]HTY90538.1 bifunctional precorrin-2 dehydrogenase/sirohydrochlorin ferrochelatase [Methanocella sp.]
MGEYLPLFLEFSCKKVVIFGGGAVGERKAKYFLPAEVVVVSPGFTECLDAMGADGIVRLERRAVREEDVGGLIEGAFLVVAATGNKRLNDAIARAAESAGILANNATGESSAIVPSLLKRGDVMVAVSTGGRSPALSRYLRLKLEAALGGDLERMAKLQERVREQLKKTIEDQKGREEVLRTILDDSDVWEALKEEDKAFELAMRHARP